MGECVASKTHVRRRHVLPLPGHEGEDSLWEEGVVGLCRGGLSVTMTAADRPALDGRRGCNRARPPMAPRKMSPTPHPVRILPERRISLRREGG